MRKLILLIFIIFLLNIFELQVFSKKNNEVILIFFDVGQGDSALLISPSGKTLLIDGGPDKLIVEKISNYLSRQKRYIDYVVLSHAHYDHYLGLISLLSYYNYGNVIADPLASNLALKYWFNILEKRNINIIKKQKEAYKIYLEKNCYFKVLASPLLFIKENVSLNNSSYSVKINCLGLKVLFTGDLEREGEEALLKHASSNFLKSDIFKAGHHGSKTSNNYDFLKKINPNLIIISVGEGNSYGHPSQELLDNAHNLGIKLLRTDEDGDIILRYQNDSIMIQTIK